MLAELVGVMDDGALAAWFVQPNEALDGRCPVDAAADDWPAVFQAARLQRYVMTS